MTGIEAIGIVVTAILVPFAVQLIKTQAITGAKAQWLAIGVSIVAGIATGLAAGIPATPAAWVTCILAAIGAVQVAYSTFKKVGVTNKILDALLAVNYKIEDVSPDMSDDELRDHAVGAVDNVKGVATEDEVAKAIAEVGAERAISDEDRRGE